MRDLSLTPPFGLVCLLPFVPDLLPDLLQSVAPEPIYLVPGDLGLQIADVAREEVAEVLVGPLEDLLVLLVDLHVLPGGLLCVVLVLQTLVELRDVAFQAG